MDASLISEAVDLVDEAAVLPPASRDSFYSDRCRERPALLSLVRSIEAAPFDSRAPMLGDALEEIVPSLFDEPENTSDPLIGARVGEHLIQSRIGEGGMGLVYRALYTRHQVEVALKVLRFRRSETEESYSRLRREVELLERCKHPAIVRARSSGQLADGRTYFTMDLVEGEPITGYCASRSLTLRERLRLLIAVCEAVHAAHAVGVIHRDLKPSNILVVAGGEEMTPASIRLLDFGIAEAAGEDFALTRDYMSVAYAAPEHERATSPETDVYSLGILMAELVVGRLPFDTGERRPAALLRHIRAHGLRPLRGIAAEHPEPWLAGVGKLGWRELQAICSKATAGEASKRYATVRELAEDIARLLTRRPVHALELSRKRRALYETWRLVSRNRLATVAAGLVVLLLAGAVSGYTWGLRQSRNAALQKAAHAEKMQRLAAGIFLDGDGSVSASLTAEGLVDRGVQSASALDTEPEEQAQFLLTLGQSYQGFGRFSKAQAAFGRALGIRARIYGPESPEAAEVMSQEADLASAEGKPGEGLALAEHALAVQQRTLPLGDKAILETESLMAELWTDLGDREKAVPLLEDVIRQERDKPALLNDLSTALNNLSIIENYLGHTQRCLELQEESIAIDRKLEGPRHADIGIHLITLSTGHAMLGEYKLAEADARAAISILTEKLAPGHHDTASAKSYLGIALMHQSRWAEAESLFNEAMRTFTAEPVRSRSEAAALWGLAATYEGEGKLSQALQIYEADLVEYKQLYPNPHSFWTAPLRGIASVALKQGKPAEAERAAREAYDICRSQLVPADIKTLRAEVLLGRALTAQQRFLEAEPLLEEAARLADASTPALAEVREQAAQALSALALARTR